jgi:phage portal protein BeeE
MPYVTLIEEEFTNKIFVPSEKGYYINLDENAILRSDKEKQAKYYSSLLEKGVLSINEVRQALGYKEIEGGDKHLIAYSDPSQNAVDNNENKDE